MQIAFAALAIFWWIAVWGLSDLLTENWSESARFWYYICLLALVAFVVVLKPDIVQRF
jgi:hypothetical protein